MVYLIRDWTGNAQCRTWFRRRPLSGAFEHPSKMVYPPGEVYTPEGERLPSSHTVSAIGAVHDDYSRMLITISANIVLHNVFEKHPRFRYIEVQTK